MSKTYVTCKELRDIFPQETCAYAGLVTIWDFAMTQLNGFWSMVTAVVKVQCCCYNIFCFVIDY